MSADLEQHPWAIRPSLAFPFVGPSLQRLVSASDAGNTASFISGDSHPQYELRTQSNLVTDEIFDFRQHDINRLLVRDLAGRTMRASDAFVESLFPDTAFGFPINNEFMKTFRGSLLTANDEIDSGNFESESSTSNFLNTMVSTIASFKQHLIPLRYFSSAFSAVALGGHPVKRKPDISLFRLINGCTQSEASGMLWRDIHGIIEVTREKKTPPRMVETVTVKSYITFCLQPERDFFLLICITGEGFRVIMIDHEGQVQTEVLPFSLTYSARNASTFFRMIMGLAFLPDEMLGLDPSIVLHARGESSGRRFRDQFPPLNIAAQNLPQLWALHPALVDNPLNPSTNNPPDVPYDLRISNCHSGIASITVNSTVYQVVRVLFVSQALIGRSTRTFLVKLPDGRYGVLKDSWCYSESSTEAEFLEAFSIPFIPQLIDHCLLRSTARHRDNPINISDMPKRETREKRRVVIYPAGYPLSEFHSLWELVVVILDVVIAIMSLQSSKRLHRDISYANILLRDQDRGAENSKEYRERKSVMEALDLSEIEKLRNELKCREGLLIDFDYADFLVEPDTGESSEEELDYVSNYESDDYEVVAENNSDPLPFGARTGTAPFIAIELLIHGSPHRVAHDLESLFYVFLFACSHLRGPETHSTDVPLYPPFRGSGTGDHPFVRPGPVESSSWPADSSSVLKDWFNSRMALTTLGHLKYSHITGHFKTHVLPGVSHYFEPLKKHLFAFKQALFPAKARTGKQAVHNFTTAQDVIAVLKNALQDQTLIDEAIKRRDEADRLSQPVLGKHSRPDEFTISNQASVKAPRTAFSQAKLKSEDSSRAKKQ